MIKETDKKLDKKFWQNFLKKNDFFKKTSVFKNAFTEEDRTLLYESVQNVLLERFKRNHFEDGLRIWRSGNELDAKEVKSFFTENPIDNEYNLLEYCRESFNEKFGIILNNNECYSEDIASRIAEMIQPLCDLVGVPPKGYEITVFIGDYGWTPLGIHTDHQGENVIHFHLGPGDKQMYTWDDKTYNALVPKNTFNNTNIEPLLHKANKFDFSKNDIYSMPWFENHVGFSGELSIAVTLWFRSSNNTNYSKTILNNFTNQFMPKDDRSIPPQIDYLKNDDTFKNFKETVSHHMSDPDISVDEFLYNMYKDYKLCLMSNAGWSKAPVLNNDIVDFEKFIDYEIYQSKPFKIYKRNQNSKKLYIFIRGNRLRIRYIKEIETFIDNLNEYKTISVRQMLRDTEMDNDALLYLIHNFYKYKGINLK